jgi:hypothetical protein
MAKPLNGLAAVITRYSLFLAFKKLTAKGLSRLFKTLVATSVSLEL